MKTGWMIAAALLLPGCVSLRAPAASDPQLAPAMAHALEAVRQVATQLEAGGPADFAPATAALERAQLAAATAALTAPHPALAGHAALGMALGFCREGVARTQQAYPAEPQAGPGLATALRLGCIAPLLLITSP